MIYGFRDFELDAERYELRRGGARVALQPKPLALLFLLVRNRDRLVTRQEIVSHLWPDLAASEDALFHAAKKLREALGDHERSRRMIETATRIRGSCASVRGTRTRRWTDGRERIHLISPAAA
jgi:DNA-binding winged helix-turn-helix (wHTH) protein